MQLRNETSLGMTRGAQFQKL